MHGLVALLLLVLMLVLLVPWWAVLLAAWSGTAEWGVELNGRSGYVDILNGMYIPYWLLCVSALLALWSGVVLLLVLFA